MAKFLFLSGQTNVFFFSNVGLVYSKLVSLGLIFFLLSVPIALVTTLATRMKMGMPMQGIAIHKFHCSKRCCVFNSVSSIFQTSFPEMKVS